MSLQFPLMKTTRAGAKRPTAPSATPTVRVRRLEPTDSISALTRLLHRAYRKQMDMGLRPLAGRQDDETTRRRCASGECYVAVIDWDPDDGQTPERPAGVILFHEVEDAQGPPWFRRRDVDYFSQFAVDPDLQGLGIGQALLDRVERRALECGATELALSMAEPDTELMNYYLRRGFRFIEHWQWPYTNYRSAILSKTLRTGR
jgi:GNAT superfamily N-acetyltransferase